MEQEWLSDQEWELEWQLFDMLQGGFIKPVGFADDGEILLSFTEKYYDMYRILTQFDSPDDFDGYQ